MIPAAIIIATIIAAMAVVIWGAEGVALASCAAIGGLIVGHNFRHYHRQHRHRKRHHRRDGLLR